MSFRRHEYWVLLAVLGVALAALPLRAAEKTTVSLAHIKLSGTLGESPPVSDPLFGGGENFKSKLDRIKKAKEATDIDALYLQLDGLRIGWAKIDELSRAIADFRKSGKKAFAYVEEGNTKDYLLALACDEVCLPETGWLMLTGIRAEVSFYKDLFEKVGVKADMLQMGDFKAAAEPFMRSSMSAPARQQLTAVIDDYYEKNIVARIVRRRGDQQFTAEQVKKLIDEGPYTARGALKAGLIDRVAYAEKFQEHLKEPLKAEKIKIVEDYKKNKRENVDLSTLSGLLKLFASMKPAESSKDPKIAVIHAVGVITTGKSEEGLFGAETVGSTTMLEAIRQAEGDKTVKAIVLRVDSPGGSALASDLIWNELKRSKKPIIASMSDVAASGGYYISMAAKKIYADPGTLTGSIGVVGGKLALRGAFDKVGIKTEIISRGANSGILSADKPFSESERKAMTALMKDVYDQFLDKALEGRQKAGKQMTRDELVKLAGGRIWTGRQAKANGLIDELGGLGDAIAAARAMTNLPADKEPDLLLLPKSKGFLDSLLDDKLGIRSLAPQMRQLLREVPELRRKLRSLDGMFQLRGEPVWLTMPYQIEMD
ncbi:MAG TPA: signal peptide peptidase SppA [Gemmataceae bacterium]|jgi:protease-4